MIVRENALLFRSGCQSIVIPGHFIVIDRKKQLDDHRITVE